MNTKTALGILALIIIVIGALFLLHTPAAAPTVPAASSTPQGPATASSTPAPSSASAPAATSSAARRAPTFSVGTPQPVLVAALDARSLSSSSAHPVITGTANTDKVGVVVANAQGVGIVGSTDIAVTNGKWSFAVPLALMPGTYTVHLVGGDKEVTGTLVVTQ